jgi:hypothetical protein
MFLTKVKKAKIGALLSGSGGKKIEDDPLHRIVTTYGTSGNLGGTKG